jgi:hypothetical protein
MTICDYMGIGIQVWNGQHSWFWLVADSLRCGAAVGAAASETEAIREACSLIDESFPGRAAADRAKLPGFRPLVSPLGAAGWERALASLERYLGDASGAEGAAL